MTDWTVNEITALMAERDAAIARVPCFCAELSGACPKHTQVKAIDLAADRDAAEARAEKVEEDLRCFLRNEPSASSMISGLLSRVIAAESRAEAAEARADAARACEAVEAREWALGVQAAEARADAAIARAWSERDAAEQMVAELRAVLESPTLLEALAAIEHERWSGWERYREQCVAAVRRAGDSETHEERWRRQRETAYADLSEREQESDRAEARKGLEVIQSALAGRGDRNS